MIKPLLVSSGEPAGIGPDICLALAGNELPIVVLGDKDMLAQRARMLHLEVELADYDPHASIIPRQGLLHVLPLACAVPVVPGQLDPRNAPYVINMLRLAAEQCLQGSFSALVTAPVNKAVINQANIPFTGHTEFLANFCQVDPVVMMLACDAMKVALVTTHLPLHAVAAAITQDLVIHIVRQLNQSMSHDFAIKNPNIFVAGLNPHAGEGGYLGREEIDVIKPALAVLQREGIRVSGPFPADTLFTPDNLDNCDVFLTMYHDQGLPVLKYAGFGQAVNVTLGLPFIRTSVDHGTALELAGKDLAESGSLRSAVCMAISMAETRGKKE